MDTKQAITFFIEKGVFGVSLFEIIEIHRIVEITKVPHAPGFIEGVLDFRGKIIPVVSLKKRFGFEQEKYEAQTTLFILKINRHAIAFMTDEPGNIVDISPSEIEKAPKAVSGVNNVFIEGVAHHDNELIILLNFEKILSATEEELLHDFRKKIGEKK